MHYVIFSLIYLVATDNILLSFHQPKYEQGNRSTKILNFKQIQRIFQKKLSFSMHCNL